MTASNGVKFKKIFAGFGLVAFLGLVATPAFAAELLAPDKASGNVVVGSQQTLKNVYTSGGNITMNGTINGDLTVAGGTITLAGKVENEVLAAGGNLYLSAPTGSHIRAAGGNITVGAPVGGDLVLLGGTVNITDKASVAGDLLVLGGTVVVDAPIAGSVRILGGSVTINNKVSGNIYVQASQGLTFGPQSEALGSIEYKGANQAQVSPTAKVGAIQFTQMEKKNFQRTMKGLLTIGFLIKLLAWFIAGMVVVRLMKNSVHGLVTEFRSKPWSNLGFGLVVSIVTPITVILLLITFVGYYLGFLLGAAYLLFMLLAGLLASVVTGYYLLAFMNKPGETPSDWQAVLIGVVVWSILGLIPVLGWLVMCLICLMTMGILAKALKAKLN
ncbi:MAG: hypothetical protein HY918_03660 [Candidatus Doudnabacteria bacterium]|nr:hypothetical protein [Candidatus Doudnabacteria bacterium]